jgi:hypothetical protein
MKILGMVGFCMEGKRDTILDEVLPACCKFLYRQSGRK